MRRVFTSPRLENVESVASLLREHEIETKITNGRTFRGAIRGNFSYREPADPAEQPAVWVVRSEDQPKARELLREAGLLDSGRSPTTYLATPSTHELRGEDGSDARKRRAFRFKAALFVAIAAALGLSMLAWRKPLSTAATATTSSSANTPKPVQTPLPRDAADSGPVVAISDTYVADTPKALAAMLVQAELAAQTATRLCLSIDGKAPVQAQIDALGLPASLRVNPAADCREDVTKGAIGIAIGEYRTDGSGTGTVRIEIADLGKDGKPRIDARTLHVQRRDIEWRVLRVETGVAPSR